jgi:peptidoglycan/xylan/chitin deacetylase (PgdA/CDA1 family)
MSKGWTPSPAIKLSFAVHGVAGAGVLAAPGVWPWALGALAVNHAVLTAAGLWPRSTLLGPNLVRLPAAAAARRQVALTIDDGPDPEVTPRVLDLLDAAAARATFFCIGRRVRRHAALSRQIAARGHRVENHGDSHSSAFAAFGFKRMRADIAACQAAIADVTGRVPRFFRPTAGLRSPLLDPVLAQLGLRLATWTRRGFDTRVGDPHRIYSRLADGLAPGDILLLHDGHAARTTDGRAVILDVLPRLLGEIERKALATVTLDDAV